MHCQSQNRCYSKPQSEVNQEVREVEIHRELVKVLHTRVVWSEETHENQRETMTRICAFIRFMPKDLMNSSLFYVPHPNRRDDEQDRKHPDYQEYCFRAHLPSRNLCYQEYYEEPYASNESSEQREQENNSNVRWARPLCLKMTILSDLL